MTHCATLWIGDSLGDVERACLRSVLRQGHSLSLYSYGRPAGVPEGIEVRDASEILPKSAIMYHRNGSPAVFADWFRYEIQRRGLGTWVDTDIYLLAPLDSERSHLFGEEEPGLINNAILRLPATSPKLPHLLRPFETRETPQWITTRARLRSRARELVIGRADLTRMPWGTTGPAALTALAKAHGVSSHALPWDVFYPVPWDLAGWIRSPRLKLQQMITSRTVAVHLWNECIKPFKAEPAAEGSFLHRLQLEGRA